MSAENVSSSRKKGSYFTPPVQPLQRRAANAKLEDSGSSGSGSGSFTRSGSKDINIADPGPVFKMPLRAIMVDQGQGYIPYIIEKSFLFINAHLSTEGLFRVNGCLPVVETLANAFDKGEDVKIHKYTDNPHDVCSLVKKFLSNLPEPLINEQMSLKLIQSKSINDFQDRLNAIRDICDGICEYEHALLECLMYFIRGIADKSNLNKMSISNLATVFGPVLTRQPDGTMNTAFRDIQAINSVLKEMIENVNYLFGIKQLGGKFADHYEVLEELGSGGFATVYLVKEFKTTKKFAAKIIRKKILKDLDVKRLDDEIMILKRVRHPNVITLHAVFETDNEVILVMELAQGGELFDKLIEDGSYNESDTVRILQQIIRAVDYLHSLNIVHRDLKPENILLKNTTTREIKICDFGLSKVFDEIESVNTFCGTPGYVAPEILFENKYSKPVDLWSIGVIAYVLLSGYPPFYSDNLPKLFAQIKGAKYNFAGKEWDNTSDEAKDFIEKLLVINPEKRMTAKEALRHPFLSGRSRTLDAVKAAALLQREQKLRRDQTRIIRSEMDSDNVPLLETPMYFNPNNSHEWKNSQFKILVKCDNCNQYMWPFYKRGFQCDKCKIRCHDKCVDSAGSCTK